MSQSWVIPSFFKEKENPILPRPQCDAHYYTVLVRRSSILPARLNGKSVVGAVRSHLIASIAFPPEPEWKIDYFWTLHRISSLFWVDGRQHSFPLFISRIASVKPSLQLLYYRSPTRDPQIVNWGFMNLLEKRNPTMFNWPRMKVVDSKEIDFRDVYDRVEERVRG